MTQGIDWSEKTGRENLSAASTFAMRYNEGKPRLSLVPPEMVMSMSGVYAYGLVKYAKDNWRKGFKLTALMDSAMRHQASWLKGEDIDAESGLPHMLLATWNLWTIWWCQEYGKGEDDR